MCNLYRLSKSNAEVARWFAATDKLRGANFSEDIFPGTPGAVIAEGALVSMNWGFPLQRKGAKGQPIKPNPVNNTRSDKLDGFFWRYSFEERRCLMHLGSFLFTGPRPIIADERKASLDRSGLYGLSAFRADRWRLQR